jgi:hypothetical protein
MQSIWGLLSCLKKLHSDHRPACGRQAVTACKLPQGASACADKAAIAVNGSQKDDWSAQS